MATIVLGTVGAIVGAYAGNPVLGFQIGAAVGSVIDTAVVGALERAWAKRPTPPEMVRNPTADAGNGVVWCAGTNVRVPGQIIYMADLRREEIVNGGERKGKQPGTSSYKYRTDIAVAWCRNEIESVKKIFANGEPIYFAGGTEIVIHADLFRYTRVTQIDSYADDLGNSCQRPAYTMELYDLALDESSPEVALLAFLQPGQDIDLNPSGPPNLIQLWNIVPPSTDPGYPGLMLFTLEIRTWYTYDPLHPCDNIPSTPADVDVFYDPYLPFTFSQTLNGVSPYFDDLECYPGDYSQDRDPTLMLALGASIPAFRGTAYCVIKNFDMTKWAGTAPQMEATVVENSTRTVADAIMLLLQRAEAPTTNIDFDVSDIRNPEIPLKGVYSVGPVPPAETLEQILALYDLQVQMRFEQTFSWSRIPRPVMRFFKRTNADVISIVEDQMTARFEDDPGTKYVTTTRNSRYDLPQEFVLDYISSDIDHQTNTTSYSVTNGSIRNQIKMSTPLVLTAEEADELCRRMFWIATRGHNTVKFSTTSQWLHIMPGDRVDMVRAMDNVTQRLYVTLVDISPSGLMEIEARLDDAQIYRQFPGVYGAVPMDVPIGTAPLTAVAIVLDIGALTSAQDEIFGLWFGFMAPGNSLSKLAQFYISRDNVNWTLETASNAVAIVGTCITALADVTQYFWDTVSVLDVVIQVGTLSSSTRELVASGANWAWVGSEIIGFVDVEVLPDNKYRLTNLLRGRLDTYDVLDSHDTNERFVLLPPTGAGVKFDAIDDSLYFVPLYVKAVMSGQSPTDPAIITTNITPAARTLAWWRPHACYAYRFTDYAICVFAHARVRSPLRLLSAALPDFSEDVEMIAEKWRADVYLYIASVKTGPVRTLCACDTAWGGIAWEYSRELLMKDAVAIGSSSYPTGKVTFKLYHERAARGVPNFVEVDVEFVGATFYYG